MSKEHIRKSLPYMYKCDSHKHTQCRTYSRSCFIKVSQNLLETKRKENEEMVEHVGY